MSPSNIPLEYTTISMRRGRRRADILKKNRMLVEEVYNSDESCVICLEKECHSVMKMCPSCENIFHSHCIAGWIIEFANLSCPHCRIRLTHRMLEDVEVVLPFKDLHTSSTQTMRQNNPAMWTGEHGYSSSVHPYLPDLRVTRLTTDTGDSSPASPTWSSVSPTWSPISPYPHHTPSTIGSPLISVNISPVSIVGTPPPATPNSAFSPGELPESPLPQALGRSVSSSAPLAFSANLHAPTASDESPRSVWAFIAEQLRREGWHSANSTSTLTPFDRASGTQ